MTTRNTRVTLTIELRGQAAQQLQRMGQEQLRQTTRVNQQWTQINNAGVRFVSTARASAQQVQQVTRLSAQLLRTEQTLSTVLAQQAAQQRRIADLTRQVEQATRRTADQTARAGGEWKEFAKDIAQTYVVMKGMQALKTGITANLTFEKELVKIQTNSNLTPEQTEQLRKQTIETSKATLQTPIDVLKGAGALSRAGMKYEDLSENMHESARMATVMDSTPEQIANMDFDIVKKMGVKNDRVKNVHNMLYYHSKQGRFEAPSLANYSPELLTATSNVGIIGEQGLNFAGALTQVLMNRASVNEPGAVKTMMEQGLGNITSSQYVKGLKSFGIDLQKYMPEGKFYGEGGVQGMLDLSAAMKKKGLQNPFKLKQAGFQEKDITNFWLSMMQYNTDIESAMENANVAAKNDESSKDFGIKRNSDYGKIQNAQNSIEQFKISPSVKKVTEWAGDVAEQANEKPVTATLGGITTATGLTAAYFARDKLIDTAKNGKLGKILGRGALPLTIAAGAAQAYDASQNPNLTQKQKNTEYTKAGTQTVGAVAGAWGGAKAGAIIGGAAGSFFPVLGNAAGAAIGGVVGGIGGGAAGWWAGREGGEAIAEAVQGSSADQTQAVDKQTQVLAAKLDNVVAAIKSQPQAATPMGFGLSEPKENRFGAPQNGSYLIVK